MRERNFKSLSDPNCNGRMAVWLENAVPAHRIEASSRKTEVIRRELPDKHSDTVAVERVIPGLN